MPKPKRAVGKSGKSGFVVGRVNFAKISAVEGIGMTAAMKQRADDAATKRLSPEERRRVIVSAYRKG
jgi:hypothetical protein